MRHDHDHDDDEEDFFSAMDWEGHGYIRQGKPFYPIIYLAEMGKMPPAGFNTVAICLDAGMRSSLRWDDAKEFAQKCVKSGHALLWKLDFGIGREVTDFSDQGQFQALSLALEHFQKELLEAFKDDTIGICIYEGSCAFADDHPQLLQRTADFEEWKRSRLSKACLSDFSVNNFYCRDLLVEYLDLLTTRIQEGIPAFVILDARMIKSKWERLCLLSRESFQHLHLIVKGALPGSAQILWEEGASCAGYMGASEIILQSPETTVGIYMPAFPFCAKVSLDPVLDILHEKQIAYKIYPESFLHIEWDGLEHLIVPADAVTDMGHRKLQGFCAAGGTAVSFGGSLNLCQETAWESFLNYTH